MFLINPGAILLVLASALVVAGTSTPPDTVDIFVHGGKTRLPPTTDGPPPLTPALSLTHAP